MTWSSDGKLLIVSSTDGFCTLITFGDNELGTVYVEKEIEEDANGNKKPVDLIKNASPQTPRSGNKAPSPQITPSVNKAPAPQITPSGNKAPTPQTTPSTGSNETKIDKNKPTPIAFRRKPKPDSSTAAAAEPMLLPQILKTSNIEIKISPNIISSNDRFESPEKKHKPVTPIQVRREPRHALTPTSVTTIAQKPSPLTTTSSKNGFNESPKSHHKKRLASSTTVYSNDHEDEEALDAWPIDQPKPKLAVTKKIIPTPSTKKTAKTILPPIQIQCAENTEDICLVYDDDSLTSIGDQVENVEDNKNMKNEEDNNKKKEETLNENGDSCDLTPKTPRRVELRTLSTPKSKKKLLN